MHAVHIPYTLIEPAGQREFVRADCVHARLPDEFHGGKQTRAPSKAIVEKNMDGIVATVQGMAADFTFLQEIDAGPSTHAYGIEEQAACAPRRSWTVHMP